jgi:hypothetical protein
MLKDDISSMCKQIEYFMDALESVDDTCSSHEQQASLKSEVGQINTNLRRIWKLRKELPGNSGGVIQKRAGRLFVASIVHATQLEALATLVPPTHHVHPPPAIALARHVSGYSRAVLQAGTLVFPLGLSYTAFYGEIANSIRFYMAKDDVSDPELHPFDDDDPNLQSLRELEELINAGIDLRFQRPLCLTQRTPAGDNGDYDDYDEDFTNYEQYETRDYVYGDEYDSFENDTST